MLLIFTADELVVSNSKVYPKYKSFIVLVDLVIDIPSTVKDASVPSTVWVKFLVEAVYEKLLVNVEEESPLGVTLTSLEAPLLPLITNTYPVPLYKIDASALSVALLIESLNCVSVVLAVDVTVIEEFEFAVKVSFALLVVLQVPKSIVNEPAPTVAEQVH